MFVPFGGSSSTETTHSPASSRSCRSVARALERPAGDDLALDREEGNARLAPLLDGSPDGRDLGRRRPAAAADQLRALVARLRGELGEVVGRRVRVDDAPAGAAGQADVRLRGQRQAVRGRAHLPERGERGLRAEPAVRPGGHDPERAQALDRVARMDAGEGLAVLVERELGDDRKRRDRLYRPDRGLELVQVVEGLDEEEVDAPPLQQARLLVEDLVGVLGSRSSPRGRPSGPIAPPISTGSPATSRASRASLTPRSTISSSRSSRYCAESLRRFAPKVFVSISSAPARMNPVCTPITASGALRFASSGQRRRETAAAQERAGATVADDDAVFGQSIEKAAHQGRVAMPSVDDALEPGRRAIRKAAPNHSRDVQAAEITMSRRARYTRRNERSPTSLTLHMANLARRAGEERSWEPIAAS